MHPLITEAYQLEQQKKLLFINEISSIDVENAINMNYAKMMKEANIGGFDLGVELFLAAFIPDDILKCSYELANAGKIDFLKPSDKAKCVNFFKDKFNIDVSSVDILQTNNLPSYAEAMAFSCDEADHYIVLPKDLKNSYLSLDLIVHELGHVVEFYHRRKNATEISDLLTFQMFSEAIAHYYQMIFMLENSSSSERISMIATVTNSYMYYCCLLIMREVKNNAMYLDRNLIMQHEDFTVFKNIYSNADIDRFFDEWNKTDISTAMYYTHSPRMGFFIALNFIKNGFDISELFKIKLPEGDVLIIDMLKQTNLDVDTLLDFKDSTQTVRQFVDGTLGKV